MTIGEIIKKIKEGNALADIAKELTIGKEKLSKALKSAGYEFNRKSGWIFSGTLPEPSDKKYTDFVKKNEGVDKPIIKNVSTKETKNVVSKVVSSERTNVIRKRSSFDIDIELMKELKIQAVIHDINVYEIVENAIRKELIELKKRKI